MRLATSDVSGNSRVPILEGWGEKRVLGGSRG
jgi:hypothetical protein